MAEEPQKPPKRMTCWNCRRYDRTVRKCLEGKTNPKRKSDSFAVAETLGLRALCHFNPFRDGLAMRMFFPCAPATIQASARSKRSKRRRLILDVITAETVPMDGQEPEMSRSSE